MSRPITSYDVKCMLSFTSMAIIVCLSILLLSSCQQSSVAQSINDPQQGSDSAKIQYIAEHLKVTYQVHSNIETDCPDKIMKAIPHCFSATIHFALPEQLFATNWFINFSQVYPIYASRSDSFNIKHINGDIHQITPKKTFKGFNANQQYALKVWIDATVITESELMPNYWIGTQGSFARVIQSTKITIDTDTGLPIYPWVRPNKDVDKQVKYHPDDKHQYASTQWLYQHNQDTPVNANLAKHSLIPTPQHAVFKTDQMLSLSSGIKLELSGFIFSKLETAIQRLERLGVKTSNFGVPLRITKSAQQMHAEGYQLEVAQTHIEITASSHVGAYYGIQSIASLLDINQLSVPLAEISDQPAYAYRGQHVDVGRNFLNKQFIFTLIEQMAAYKLNKLHMHLAEDEGWRIELPSLPELTQIGSRRCMDLADKYCLQPQLGSAGASERDGFYSQKDYMDILRYAKKHHIQVIPSLDMPGHSRAAVKSMEARYRRYIRLGNKDEATRFLLTDLNDTSRYSSIQHYSDNTINVCLDSTYRFVEQVLSDLITLHEKANHPLEMYHIGADETAGAWVDSAACKSLIARSSELSTTQQLNRYFIEKVSQIIADKGIAVGGWNDGLGETRAAHMPAKTYSYNWHTLPHGAHLQTSDHARRDWQVVLATPDVLYFDFPYEVDPKEPGYNWASRRIDSRNLFNFMPENLPAHAEFRKDMNSLHYQADDTAHQSADEDTFHQPLARQFKLAGIQGQLWTETVRSANQAQYMLFPRLLALAERAWHLANWQPGYQHQGAVYSKESNFFTTQMQAQREKEWRRFVNTLVHKELPKLDAQNIFYRVPTPGAVWQEGILRMNSSLPGLPLEYQDEQGNWHAYTHPLEVAQPVNVRAKTYNGLRAGRSLTLRN